MPFEFQTVDPQSVRDDVVNFFWDHRRWPGETRDDYYDRWDWRYSALSEGPALVHLARLKATGQVVGHIGVYRRNFRVDDVTLRVGVPGNLFTHPDWQKSIVGVRLVMFLRSLVQNGEFDAVIAFGNPIANGMFARFHFDQLGPMHTYVDLRDAKPVLRRRNRAFTVLAPPLNLSASVRRGLKSRLRGARRSKLRVSKLTPDQVLHLDRSHWAPPSRVVAWDSNRFLLQRYLMEPGAPRHIYGLFDPLTASLESYVVTDTTSRIKIWDCQVNPATIDPPSAIAAVVSQWPNAETVLVSTLPNSRLARDLVQAGFIDREFVDSNESTTLLSTYSLPGNPHAGALRDPARWNIWLGSRHY
jgi:hypothetical protein